MPIKDITRDEAKALLKELDKIDDLVLGEQIDTTIYDSIKRRNEIDEEQNIESDSQEIAS